MKTRFVLAVMMLVGGFSSACDGLVEGDRVATTEAALVRGDGLTTLGKDTTTTAPAGPRRGASFVSSWGGPATTFNDLVIGEPGGVVRDCSATAPCGAACSVTGDGACDAFSDYVVCHFYYPCGENTCSSTTHVDCD